MPIAFNRKILLATSLALLAALIARGGLSQTTFPEPPNDLTRVYYLSSDSKLLPLPFEQSITTVKVFAPAPRDEITRVVLRGAKANTVIAKNNPRFYVFVADKMDPAPHQLLRLTERRSTRELAISLIKGRKGYAPFAADYVKVEHRILERLRVDLGKGRFIFVNYMELRPSEILKTGEYAIIGDSLQDIATFSIQ